MAPGAAVRSSRDAMGLHEDATVLHEDACNEIHINRQSSEP